LAFEAHGLFAQDTCFGAGLHAVLASRVHPLEHHDFACIPRQGMLFAVEVLQRKVWRQLAEVRAGSIDDFGKDDFGVLLGVAFLRNGYAEDQQSDESGDKTGAQCGHVEYFVVSS
jgi:hypothetical protein